MVGEPQPLFDRVPHAFGQVGGLLGVGPRQQDGHRVFGVPRHPVVLPKILPDQNAEPFEHLVADAVAVVLVDGRQPIDVEENQRDRITVASGPLDFFGEHRVEHTPCVERRQAIDDGGARGLELRALGVGRQQVERGAANQLRHERPRLAGRADGFAEREFVEGRPFGQIGEGEQPFDRQRVLEDHPVQVADESTPGIQASITDRKRQQLGEQLTHAVPVACVDFLAAAIREDRDGVGRDEFQLVHEHRGNLLAEIVRRLAGTLVTERGIGCVHAQGC